jgi:hypothetical protein
MRTAGSFTSISCTRSDWPVYKLLLFQGPRQAYISSCSPMPRMSPGINSTESSIYQHTCWGGLQWHSQMICHRNRQTSQDVPSSGQRRGKPPGESRQVRTIVHSDATALCNSAMPRRHASLAWRAGMVPCVMPEGLHHRQDLQCLQGGKWTRAQDNTTRLLQMGQQLPANHLPVGPKSHALRRCSPAFIRPPAAGRP